MTGASRRIGGLLRRFGANPRFREEAGWVVLTKSVEFAIVFVLLKLLTNTLGKDGYGEYNLAETALVLMTQLVLVPIRESYLRDYHGAVERGERRAAGMILIRWYAVTTIGIALLAVVLSQWISERFEFGRWTAVAWAFVFVFDRWLFVALEALNMRRERRSWALRTIAYQGTLVVSIAAALWIGPTTPATALFGYAFASFIFAIVVAGPLVREVLALPLGRPSDLLSMAVSFGIPFSALLMFQWIQGFSDRYILNGLLDTEAVGLYVAAYQVAGIPYSLMVRVGANLLVPIAYQRGLDAGNATRLWSADKILLAGIGVQLVVGAIMLVFYQLFGPRLVVLLTNDTFVVSAVMVTTLAAGRYVQAIGLATQPIFAVHQRIYGMLWIRFFGAAVMVGICYPMIRTYGVFGAALGSLLSITIYVLVLWFGPVGCWWLIRDARRAARVLRSDEAADRAD